MVVQQLNRGYGSRDTISGLRMVVHEGHRPAVSPAVAVVVA